MAKTDKEPKPAELPKLETGKRWIVSTKGGGLTSEVNAETIEDAIRAFNGSKTSYTRKQLDIVEG